MNSDLVVEITGHISGKINEIQLRDGVGCAFRVLVTRSYIDGYGVARTQEMWIPVITFDTNVTGKVLREFATGSFVQIISRELRQGDPREYKGTFYNNFNFVIDAIETARTETGTVPDAETAVLAGVTG